MMLLDMLDNISEQLRLSPISTSDNIVQWLTQSIKSACVKSKFLEKFTIIPAKANVARYLLPADHIATTGALFDGELIGRINAPEVEFVSPTAPQFYYEDNWEDEASEAGVSEFATHYTLNELWPLQLMRSQPSAGAKTLTLVAAPTADGTAVSSPIIGVLDGTLDDSSLIWSNTHGVVVSVLSSEGNLLVFYKYIDTLPVDSTTDIEYSDLLGILYNAGTLALALSTEDDEYDRYRSWLYDYIFTAVSTQLASIAVNKGLVEMGILQLISRQIGAGDIAWGVASFSYVDENGISHTMQQVNATLIPGAVVQDEDGNVTIIGILTVGYVDSLNVIGATAIGGTLNVAGVLTLSGDSLVIGNAGIDFTTNLEISAAGCSIKFLTGAAGVDLRATIKEDGTVNISSLPTYANNVAALAGGLVAGDLYRILLDPANSSDPACVGVVY